MRRRAFITLIGGAATWPIVARGQQSSIPVIGFINGSSATAYAAYVQAFIRGLAETGHTVGENVAIEYRWVEGHYDRIPDMVDDLVRRRVAVLAMALGVFRCDAKNFDAMGGTADIDRSPAPIASEAYDPKLPSGNRFCCDAQQRFVSLCGKM